MGWVETYVRDGGKGGVVKEYVLDAPASAYVPEMVRDASVVSSYFYSSLVVVAFKNCEGVLGGRGRGVVALVGISVQASPGRRARQRASPRRERGVFARR